MEQTFRKCPFPFSCLLSQYKLFSPPNPGANPSCPGRLPDLAPPVFASSLFKHPRRLQGKMELPLSLDKGEIQQLGEVIFGPDTNAK